MLEVRGVAKVLDYSYKKNGGEPYGTITFSTKDKYTFSATVAGPLACRILREAVVGEWVLVEGQLWCTGTTGITIIVNKLAILSNPY